MTRFIPYFVIGLATLSELAQPLSGMPQHSGYVNHPLANSRDADRVTFMLKNTSNNHRMFRVEGPGIAYGFTMNRREMIPCHWPIGSKLYFSNDGETKQGLILTVMATDEGRTLVTGIAPSQAQSASQTPSTSSDILVRFRNNSLLPRKVAIITYKPDETGNGTQIITLGPYASTRQQLPIGTRVYFANHSQVNTVMSGRPLTDKPSLVVGKAHHQRIVNIW